MTSIFESGKGSVKACVAKWESKLGDVQVSRGLLTESLSGGESSDQTSPNQYFFNNSQYSDSQYSNSFISDGSKSPVNSPFTTQVAAIARAQATGAFMKEAANLLSIPEVVLKVQQDLKQNVITYEFLKPEAPRKSKGKRLRSQSPAPFRKADEGPPKDPRIVFAPVIQQLNGKLGRQQQPLVEERPRKRRCFSFRGISTTVILGYLGTYLFNAFVNRMTGQALDLFQMQMAGAFFGSFMGGDQTDNETGQLQTIHDPPPVDFGTFRFLNDSSAIKVDNAGLEQLFGDYTF